MLAGADIDTSWARSKPVDEFLGQPFDYVITVCDDARESCPVFPGGGEIAPLGLSRTRPRPPGPRTEIMAVYRRTFAAIGERIGLFIPFALRQRAEAEIATAPGAIA